jgi:hypothetical protein
MQRWFNMFESSQNRFLFTYVLSSPTTNSNCFDGLRSFFHVIYYNGDQQMIKYIIKLSIVVWLQGMNRCDRLIQVGIANRIFLTIETWTHHQNNGVYIQKKKKREEKKSWQGVLVLLYFCRPFVIEEAREFFK